MTQQNNHPLPLRLPRAPPSTSSTCPKGRSQIPTATSYTPAPAAPHSLTVSVFPSQSNTGSPVLSRMNGAATRTVISKSISSTTRQTKPSLLPQKTFVHHCVGSLKTPTPHITCLAVHHNLLYAASLNLINVFDVSQYKKVDAFNNNPASGFVKSIAFSESKIFPAHQDCKIRVWLTTSSNRHRLVLTLPTVKDRLSRFILPRNYVNVRRHKRRLWIQHCDTVTGLVVKEGLLYSVSWDKSFKIWEVSHYRCLESVKGAHDDAINAVAVSGNGTVYTASADGHIRVWGRDDKVRRHTLVSTLQKQKSTVNALALNGDGTLLFSGGGDGTVSVWERKHGAGEMVLAERLEGHHGAILCLDSVEGLLASGSADQMVRIWEHERNSGYCCKAVLAGHEKPVKSLVALPAGSSNGVVTLVSGSLDGFIMVWNVFGLTGQDKNLSG